MEKTNVSVLFPIMLSVLLIIFLVSPWSATGQQDFHKNDNTKDNTPIIRISHTNRAVEGQLVTLDASKSLIQMENQ